MSVCCNWNGEQGRSNWECNAHVSVLNIKSRCLLDGAAIENFLESRSLARIYGITISSPPVNIMFSCFLCLWQSESRDQPPRNVYVFNGCQKGRKCQKLFQRKRKYSLRRWWTTIRGWNSQLLNLIHERNNLVLITKMSRVIVIVPTDCCSSSACANKTKRD